MIPLLPATIEVPPTTPSDEMRLGWRIVHPDMRSKNGFRWPFPGQWAHAEGPFLDHDGACPRDIGDGICIAKTFRGAASGGITSPVYMLVGFLPLDVLGEERDKVRVRKAFVVDVFTYSAFVGPCANLRYANLRYANLYGADLSGADLYGADLRYADLSSANLRYANLYGADLSGADLYGADLRGADLRYANLSGAAASVAPPGWKLDRGLLVRA